jgi:hypothetical protein
MEHRAGEGVIVQQQHAAVPQRRIGALQRREMGIDLGALVAREQPRPRDQR